ncbi:related to cell polarity protein tea1p [Fusarium torulosum]|uniref:Related to cell polarity protein tea1p n=1 Tax=Fusarium torulosum TaxID=33205 RepID=A0AAE8SM92_9HYPO|nr:related to cell polarity protein tea1p [Fusarium torulosum]
MAFLFKSKKHPERSQPASRDAGSGSQGSIQSAGAGTRVAEKNAVQQRGTPTGHRATPTGSLNSIEHESSNASPDNAPVQGHVHGHGRRGGSADQPIQQPSDVAVRNAPPVSGPNASLYPWSQRRLTYTSTHPSPFPRYGAAVNSVSSKEGDVYLMGGLINGSTVKGDLWMIEAGGNMACYPLATTAEGPGPRVGHSSLLVGNAFIVYGGDTKIDESDTLDETLYLLNTSTRQWSRALPAGPRPSGRYGHSLNILGSKIYVFGGQVEGLFMNDLSAFDLNQLQMPNNRWEILVQGETSPKMPAPRTNHTMITFNDKMYLFGGTNGFQWFNDVWCYDPAANKWSQFDCIGYIPAPREGHAAALVDDVMYVFGGRTEEGTDLGDLAAFRISSRRWYTFQNMGPSPSPRSGHSMTTVGKSIVILGGEPSSATTSVSDLGLLYVLDTSKIRYPNDAQQAPQPRVQGSRRPSAASDGSRPYPARDGSNGPTDSRKMIIGGASAPPNGQRSPPNNADGEGPQSALANAKLPRASAMPPSGPPPQGPMPARPTVDVSAVARVRGQSAERSGSSNSPRTMHSGSPITREVINEVESPMSNGQRTPVQPPVRAGSRQDQVNGDMSKAKQPQQTRIQASTNGPSENLPKPTVTPRPASPPAPTRQASNPISRRASGRNSQTVVLLKELDSARNRNAWYASELELARKSGYVPNTSSSPLLDNKATETFDDEDRPLIEALLAMRTELANVQNSVDKQAVLAAKQIAEAEKQRDAAIQEAVYSKAKLAAHLGGSSASTPQLDGPRDDYDSRSGEFSRKLASALHVQKDLQSRLDSAKSELESEKKARQLADDTSNAAQKRMAELESYKQQTSTEVERLKAELHLAQHEAREHSVARAEIVAAVELLRIEKSDMEQKYQEAVGSSKDHSDTFESLRAAIVASEDSTALLESKLAEERTQREKVETQLNKLKFEHEARTAELVATTQRLRDAEELSEKHAAEARTTRQAVLAGLDKISARDVSGVSKADTERLAALQSQLATSNELVKKYQQELEAAADKLRGAEERIAGLEQYQEQSSREGVTIRRQLQSALRDTQSLQAANTDLKNQLAAQQLETNAMSVQHNALKDILSERGISPTTSIRARNLPNQRINSPDMNRARDLESQLASSSAAHEETKQAFAIQIQESEAAWREKLSQLESDYQSAVHYVKGTEKMLKQLKEQLSRYKTENSRLKTEIEELEDRAQSQGTPASPGWESEKAQLQTRIQGLEKELQEYSTQMEKRLLALQTEIQDANNHREAALKYSEEATQKLTTHRKDLEQLQSENALLEQRANDAEQKVALLLDQVEHSVDNYRRRSRQVPSMNSEMAASANGLGLGHSRQESSESGSVYGPPSGNAGASENAGATGKGGLEARNSAALDSLASELETLRSQWEATNKNYRLSTNFDFETAAAAKKDDDSAQGVGLSESLADWRKRLDTEDHHSDGEKPRQS